MTIAIQLREMKAEIERLRDENTRLRAELLYELAITRQDVALLKEYLAMKEENMRRDYDLLVVDIHKEIMTRSRGMDYNDIQNYFRFGSRMEAYRLMELAEKRYPDELKIKKICNGTKRWKSVLTRIES